MRIFGSNKELQILKRFSRGDSSAMDMLYAAYADYLMGICCRYIASPDDRKDVLQEALVKIFTSIGSFTYRGEGSLKAWAARIVVNESLQYLRQQAKSAPLEGEAKIPDLPDDEPPDDRIPADALVGLIQQLPPGYRAVFNLFAIDGLSHKEIARQLGITPSTSASQYFKARAMLARMIKQYQRNNP